MTEVPVLGRRQRKKAATRKLISDIATQLFLERGFDAVSVREVADAADVSPTTVFAYFPQKEALVFDEADAQREHLVAAVRDREPGTSISRALFDYLRADYAETVHFAGEHAAETIRAFTELIKSTPALADYEGRMWTSHEDALAAAIAAEFGQAEPAEEVRAFVRFVLQVWQLMNLSADPMQMLDAAYRILEPGWAAYAREAAGEVPTAS